MRLKCRYLAIMQSNTAEDNQTQNIDTNTSYIARWWKLLKFEKYLMSLRYPNEHQY